MIKLSLIVFIAILALIAVIYAYRHIKWKYVIYPRIEKTLEEKYHTRFKCVEKNDRFAESYRNSPILDFSINHYIVSVACVDTPYPDFDCWINRDYQPYTDDYLLIKQGYEASLTIKPIAREYFSDYRMSCIMEEAQEDPEYVPDLNVYVLLHYTSSPDIDKIIAFAQHIVNLNQQLGREIRLYLAVTDRAFFTLTEKEDASRIAFEAQHTYSHEFDLFFTTEKDGNQITDTDEREEYLSRLRNEYNEKMELMKASNGTN